MKTLTWFDNDKSDQQNKGCCLGLEVFGVKFFWVSRGKYQGGRPANRAKLRATIDALTTWPKVTR